jgi:hypothetical protein
VGFEVFDGAAPADGLAESTDAVQPLLLAELSTA